MNTAYSILEVSEDADDGAIKQAYLQQIRLYPPGQSPERFEQIRQAFESLQTAQDRAHYALFNRSEIDLKAFLAQHLKCSTPRRPTPKQLLEALADSAK